MHLLTKARVCAQSEEYEASLADDDLLAQMRQKK
jgi:hypothetical protein